MAVLREAGLTVKQPVNYATNAYFVRARGDRAGCVRHRRQALKRDDVEYCHPELIRRGRQGHLRRSNGISSKTTIGGVVVDAHANVEAAHAGHAR